MSTIVNVILFMIEIGVLVFILYQAMQLNSPYKNKKSWTKTLLAILAYIVVLFTFPQGVSIFIKTAISGMIFEEYIALAFQVVTFVFATFIAIYTYYELCNNTIIAKRVGYVIYAFTAISYLYFAYLNFISIGFISGLLFCLSPIAGIVSVIKFSHLPEQR